MIILKVADELTRLELQILLEINGDVPKSAWGAWVGACLGHLKGSGYISKTHKLTDKGKNYLTNLPKSSVIADDSISKEI